MNDDDEHSNDDENDTIGQSPQNPLIYTGQERSQLLNPHVKYATIDKHLKEFNGAAFHNTNIIHVDYAHAKELKWIGRGVFYDCSFLTRVKFPPFLQQIHGHAFRDCRMLKELDFSLCEELVSIGSLAFDGCRSVKELTFPATLKELSNGAFAHCKALQVVDFSKATAGFQTIGRQAFICCTSLHTIHWPSSLVTIDERAFFKCGALTELDFATVASLKAIQTEAFQECALLKSVIYPANLETIQEFAFFGCSQLDTIDFHNCSSQLKIVKSSAFAKCPSLKNVLLASEEVMEAARQATPVSFWGQPTACVWDLLLNYKQVAQSPKEEPFLYTGQSEHVTPKNLQSVKVDAQVKQILDRAFAHCTQLQEVDLRHATSLERIEKEAFCECSSLVTCEFPANLKFIGHNAFCRCDALETVSFSSSNQLQSIGETAFFATAFTKISIPYSVTTLGKDPFDSSKLERIDIMGNGNRRRPHHKSLALSLRLSLWYRHAFCPTLTMDRKLYLYSYHKAEGFTSGLLNWPMADGEMEEFREIQRNYPDALFRLVRFCAETQVLTP